MSPRCVWCVAALLAGCSFELAPGGSGDAVTADARPPDASPDAASPDVDGDTILNGADNCPLVANLNQRDHDIDLRGDACDRCPHLPSATDPDTDGDGVGDDCDPRSTVGGDAVALWDGFYAQSAALSWTKLGTWTLDAGTLRQTATGTAYIAFPMDLPRAFVQAAAVVDGVNGNSSTIGVFAGDPLDNVQSYGCLAIRSSGSQEIAASAKWLGNPGSFTPIPWNGAVAVATSFRFDFLLTTAAACTVRQGGEVATVSEIVGPIAGKAGIYLDDVQARFDYVFVVQVGS